MVFSTAHARLLFREEVMIEDAVVAVTVMESSMQVPAALFSLMVYMYIHVYPYRFCAICPLGYPLMFKCDKLVIIILRVQRC